MNLSHYLVPILVCGTDGGVATQVPGLGCHCCLWWMGAGAAAVLWGARAAQGSDLGTGALVGLLAGLASAVTASAVEIPKNLLARDDVRSAFDELEASGVIPPDVIPPELLEMAQEPALLIMVILVFNFTLQPLFGLLGGLCAGQFGGRTSPPKPPPPVDAPAHRP